MTFKSYLLLIAITCLSQFYRVSNNVISPELTRDLDLSPRELGWAGSAFFFALLALQIPVGMWFDRFGARRTVAALSILTVIGSLWIARATDATDLIIGRAIVGVGCAASFMAVVFICARWCAPERLAAPLSWVFAASNIGTLAAGAPLAWIAATVGWREGFVALSALTILVTVAFYAVVRDHPPEVAARQPRTGSGSFLEIARGWGDVFRVPGVLPMMVMHFFYATLLTILGVWGGPYLFDVHHLDVVARGNVLLMMGIAQILGTLTLGPLDRLSHSRKRVVSVAAVLSIAMLALLAVLRDPPLWLAVCLLTAFCFCCPFGSIIVAQGRALFPDRLAGRGVTTINMAQCLGLTALPAATGYIVDGLAANEVAYRAVFAFLAASLSIGLLAYRCTPNKGRPT